MFEESLFNLERYITEEGFKGYDPYDTLNSWVPFHWLGKWGPVLGIQFQKKNPINIRPILGVGKSYNPKAMGLFLHAYSLRYQKTQQLKHRKTADFFFNWLCENFSKNYSGKAWGYDFPWASPVKFLDSYVPSAVVTGFVCRGMYEYNKIVNNSKAKQIIKSAANFINNDLGWYRGESGLCISYTPTMNDICYNASLLAAEVLVYNYELNGDEDDAVNAIKAVEFVLKRQKSNGLWAYSEGKNGSERIQTDFHQGYVLESIYRIQQVLVTSSKSNDQLHEKLLGWNQYIKKGLTFYKEMQFDHKGKSFWRLPKEWPVEIHNQAQGIIVFNLFKDMVPEYKEFSNTILDYTINNMQDKNGFFYYRKYKHHTNKIPYMRWSQAWMFLALTGSAELHI